MVTLTARPASGTPRACSFCFISTPGTLPMPPSAKSAGSVNMISMVWLAGSALSVLRRSDQVMRMLALGDLDVGADRQSRGQTRPRRYGLGAPERRADIALALRITRILVVQHDLLRHRSGRRVRRAGRRRARLADAVGDLRRRAGWRRIFRFLTQAVVGIAPPSSPMVLRCQ